MRMPYRPPADMTTLLSGGRFTITSLMILLDLAWLGSVAWYLRKYHASLKDVAVFSLLSAILFAIIVYTAANPPWPVANSYVK